MRSFIAALIAVVVLAGAGALALSMMQESARVAFTTSGARVDEGG